MKSSVRNFFVMNSVVTENMGDNYILHYKIDTCCQHKKTGIQRRTSILVLLVQEKAH